MNQTKPEREANESVARTKCWACGKQEGHWVGCRTTLPKPYINTVGGKAKFVETRVEDENENWDSTGLTTSNGFWVIHEGKEHHVYEVEDDN